MTGVLTQSTGTVQTHSAHRVTIRLLINIYGDVISRDAQPAIIEDLRRAPGSRIVGGWPAADNQIPHQISLRMVTADGGVFSCGGSIIHNQWVLTAAHCVANRFSFVVRLGLTNLTRPEYIVETTRKYIHPEYDEIRAGVQTADIALVGLNDYIPYSDSIQPCRLQSSEQKNTNYEGVVLTVSGYGRTDDLWNGYVRPGHYQDWIREVTNISFDWKLADLQAITSHLEPMDKVIVVDRM